MAVRVWDLVLKKEIGTMKPKGVDNNKASHTTCFAFTKDRKTIITGGRDGCLHFWNAMDNYKLIQSIKIQSLGGLQYDEINAMLYLADNAEDPCLLLGCLSGQICLYSINR